MAEFIAREDLPPGIAVGWEGVDEWGWDRIRTITVKVGTDGKPSHAGILAVKHTISEEPKPLLTAAQETVALLQSLDMNFQRIADVTERSYNTIKTHQKHAVKRLGDPGPQHLVTQCLFDMGLLVVQQHLAPVVPPHQEGQKLLRLLSQKPKWAAVGSAWRSEDLSDGRKGIAGESVRSLRRDWRGSGELPSGIQSQQSFVLWWNLLDKTKLVP